MYKIASLLAAGTTYKSTIWTNWLVKIPLVPIIPWDFRFDLQRNFPCARIVMQELCTGSFLKRTCITSWNSLSTCLIWASTQKVSTYINFQFSYIPRVVSDILRHDSAVYSAAVSIEHSRRLLNFIAVLEMWNKISNFSS